MAKIIEKSFLKINQETLALCTTFVLPLIHQTTTVMHYSQLTIIYKTYLITKRADIYGLWVGESNAHEKVLVSPSYDELIEWIDAKWDGKDPEGYFQKY